MTDGPKNYCRPGDILEYRCPNFGIVFQWRVRSVCLGAARQESLVELSPIMAAPGVDAWGRNLATTWVPEVLVRSLTIAAREIAP
jgi:hypothetical protein